MKEVEPGALRSSWSTRSLTRIHAAEASIIPLKVVYAVIKKSGCATSRFPCRRQVYDEQYKLAIYVMPSRCDDEVCNSARIRLPATEELPCRQPLDMPTGFLHPSVSKNQTLNFTVFALEDVLLKVRAGAYS